MNEKDPQFFRHMEHALINDFSVKAALRFKELHETGKRHPYLVSTALCGQDKALADYLFAAGGRFALIEFKANAERLKTEGGKPQRLRLLQACIADSARLSRSRAIHHAAWGESGQLTLPGLAPQTQMELVLAPYIDKIGAVLDMNIPKRRQESWTVEAYIRSYLESKTTGANVRRFKRYLTELYELVGTGGVSGLAGFQGLIMIYVPALERSEQFQTITFNSFQHLMELTIHYTPQKQRDLERPPEHERGRGMEP